jgi:hypothetical protein
MYLKGRRPPRVGIHDPVSIEQSQRAFARKQMDKQPAATKEAPAKKKGRPPADANGVNIEERCRVARAIDKKRIGQVVCVEGWAVTVEWPSGERVGYPSHWLVVQRNGN